MTGVAALVTFGVGVVVGVGLAAVGGWYAAQWDAHLADPTAPRPEQTDWP